MQLLVNGDVTFALGWQANYIGRCRITGVHSPQKPNKAFYDLQFPALDAKIKTKVAFALLAPFGWNGERCWYDYDALPDYGWEPVAWKESTHIDKTFVQLYMRTLDRPDATERPTFPTGDADISYSGTAKGRLPYLGCSSILSDFVKIREKIVIPRPNMYRPFWSSSAISAEGKKRFKDSPEHGAPSSECLHFIRVVRPSSLSGLKTLKQEHFRLLQMLNFSLYWVKGKKGLGRREDCEY